MEEVSLIQMLDARERRVHHQQELLARYGKPLVCFTMNIAGPVKDTPLIRRGFARDGSCWSGSSSAAVGRPFPPMSAGRSPGARPSMCWTLRRWRSSG